MLVVMLTPACGVRPERPRQGTASTAKGATESDLARGATPGGGACVPMLPPDAGIAAAPSQTRFAVLGDYGSAGDSEAKVATLVKGWKPDFIITTGARRD